jgi:phosphoribosylanthranilate isomerase
MKIKICGFTQAENAKQASMLGIDAIGLVFYDKSPRHVEVEDAIDIVNSLPPFINRVGLFVNAETSFIDEILCEVPIDTLQFHGDENPEQCSQYGMPFIKALRVNRETDIAKLAIDYSQASGLLLDSFDESSYGGTGKSFNWSLVNVEIDMPIILAGGLRPETVAEAIRQLNPYAVDVSSGVESSKGIKDIDKIKQFIEQANK